MLLQKLTIRRRRLVISLLKCTSRVVKSLIEQLEPIYVRRDRRWFMMLPHDSYSQLQRALQFGNMSLLLREVIKLTKQCRQLQPCAELQCVPYKSLCAEHDMRVEQYIIQLEAWRERRALMRLGYMRRRKIGAPIPLCVPDATYELPYPHEPAQISGVVWFSK